MATIAKGPAEPYNPPREAKRDYLEAATQTYKKGAVLIVNAAGFVLEGGADPDNILGIAVRDGQNGAAAGDKTAETYLALPHVYFVMNIGGAVATAQTQLGSKFGLVKEGDNWHVDTAEVAAVAVIIVDFDARDAIGDTNGRVIVKFLDSRTLWE